MIFSFTSFGRSSNKVSKVMGGWGVGVPRKEPLVDGVDVLKPKGDVNVEVGALVGFVFQPEPKANGLEVELNALVEEDTVEGLPN